VHAAIVADFVARGLDAAPGFAANGDLPSSAFNIQNASRLLQQAGIQVQGRVGPAVPVNPDITHSCGGLFSVTSKTLRLQSAPTVAATGIEVIADGGPANPDSIVTITAGKQTSMTGGPQAYFKLQTDAGTGLVVLSCGAAGTLKLQSDLFGVPNEVVLEPTGITIKSNVKITLQCGASSLTMTPASIELKNGTSVLTLEPASTSIEVTPASGIVVEATETSISSPTVSVEASQDFQCVTPLANFS
jgi:hypothetical protein